MLGTSEALRRLGTRPRHAFARALLRDARWDSAQAGEVPFLGAAGGMSQRAGTRQVSACAALPRIAAARWAGASIGGGLAGAIAGVDRRAAARRRAREARRPSPSSPCWHSSERAAAPSAGRASAPGCRWLKQSLDRNGRSLCVTGRAHLAGASSDSRCSGSAAGASRRWSGCRSTSAAASRASSSAARRDSATPPQRRAQMAGSPRLAAAGGCASPAIHRRRVRLCRSGIDARRTASRRRHGSPHRSSLARIPGDADAARHG